MDLIYMNSLVELVGITCGVSLSLSNTPEKLDHGI